MRFSAFFVRGGRVIQEGIAVPFVLVWAKRHDVDFFQMANKLWGINVL
jgi:hypothetical protein